MTLRSTVLIGTLLICLHGAALAGTTAYQPVQNLTDLAKLSQSTLHAHVLNVGDYDWYSTDLAAVFAPQNQACPGTTTDKYFVAANGIATTKCWVKQIVPSDTVFATTASVDCTSDAACARLKDIEIDSVTIGGTVTEADYAWQADRISCSYEYFRPSGTSVGQFCRTPVGASSLAGVLPGVSGGNFDTTAAMLAAFGAGAVIPTSLHTGGRDVINDNGGGWWRYDSTDSTTADDGGPVRVDANGHRFKFLKTQPIMFDLFGAHPTNAAAANSTPLQTALDWQFANCTVGLPQSYTLHGSGMYQFDVPLGYTAATAAGGHVPTQNCVQMTLEGTGLYTTQLQYVGTVPYSAALDWSSELQQTIKNIAIVTTAPNSVACFSGRMAKADGSQGATNWGTIFIGAGCWNQGANGIAGGVFQDDDLFTADNQTVFRGTPNIQTATQTVYSGIFGETMPPSPITGSSGIAQGGSSTYITLDSGASAVDNAFNGLPMRVYPTNSAGRCTGTFQVGIVASYSGSLKRITPTVPWSTFTPTNTACYVIYAIKPFNPTAYSGLSTSNGSTQYELNGHDWSGGIKWTGGTELNLNSLYWAQGGNPSVGWELDLGRECISQPLALLGRGANVEDYGSNGATFKVTNGALSILDVSGRITAGGSSTAVFKDSADSFCGVNKFSNIHLKNSASVTTPIFSLTNALQQFTGVGENMSATGTVPGIGYCEFFGNNQPGGITYNWLSTYCSRGGEGSFSIAGALNQATGTNGSATTNSSFGIQPTQLDQRMATFATAGDNVQHIAATRTIPANFMASKNNNVFSSLRLSGGGPVAAGSTVMLQLKAGSTHHDSSTVTIAGTDFWWEAILTSTGTTSTNYLSWSWKIGSSGVSTVSGNSGPCCFNDLPLGSPIDFNVVTASTTANTFVLSTSYFGQ